MNRIYRTIAILVFTTCAASSTAATMTLDTTRAGITSKGGINHERGNPLTGTLHSYGDIFKANYIFDFSSILGGSINIDAVTLILDVNYFVSSQTETLIVGGFSGDLAVLKTNNFTSPTFTTNRRIYPLLVETSFGEISLDNSVSGGDEFSIRLNAEGLAAAQYIAGTSVETELALAISFGIPVYGNVDRYLRTASAHLVVEYSEIAPVPLPASGLLLLSALSGLGLASRKYKTA